MSLITAPNSVAPGAQVNGDDVLYEVVNGQYTELPPMGAYQTNLASRLLRILANFAEEHALGRVVQEMLFVLDAQHDLRRRPDVAFVSYRRWPKHRRVPDAEAWDVVPELAVEIISPTNTSRSDNEKLHEYFRADVQQVWVVYPDTREIYAYSSPTDIRVVTVADELDGGTLLPGFRLPLAALFEVEETSTTGP